MAPAPRGAPQRAARPAPVPRAVERSRGGPRQAVQPQRLDRQLRVQQRQENLRERTRDAQRPQQERVQRARENRQELQTLRNKQQQELRAKGLSQQDRQKLRADQRQQLQDLRGKQRERLQADRPDRDAIRPDRQADRPDRDRSDRRAAGPRAKEREANRQQRETQRAQRIQERRHSREQRGDRAERRISREQARAGRFASRFADGRNRRDARNSHLIARQAWRNGRRAAFVAWLGPVFYPYLYSDFFDYTFFPYAYDEGYWAYAYDDFVDGVFFAYGSPYADDPTAAPLASVAPATTGSVSPQQALNPQTRRNVEQVCNPTQALTAWPFRQIETAVRPTAEQKKLLDDLKAAANEAAEAFKSSCRTDFAMTPTGRLDAMTSRIEASLDALAIVRPALEAFYNSLSDEQRARFDAIGPDLGKAEARAARAKPPATAGNACGGEKAGLSAVPIDTLREQLRPNEQQQAGLNKLDDATNAAIDALAAACPDSVPLTPTGRLEAMEKRLTAMLDAAETIRPALEEFYGSLTNEQKARFNTLGRQAQRAN